MTDDLTTNITAQILRELGEIRAGQDHMQTDIADIKQKINLMESDRAKIDDRVRKLETTQAECHAQKQIAASAINKATVVISTVISAVIAIIIAFLPKGGS